jgi:hypothetical protein
MAALAEDFPDFLASFVLSRKWTPLLMDAHNHKTGFILTIRTRPSLDRTYQRQDTQSIAKDFANMKPKAFMDNTLTR